MSVTQEDNIGTIEPDDNAVNKPEKVVTVIVDDEPVRTPKDTTPGKVLVAAGLDPTKRELVEVHGKHQTPYPDPNVELKVHEGEQFITISTGGTPVS
jgi:hypothetical protein